MENIDCCSTCVYSKVCKGMEKDFCTNNLHILYATKEDKELCDMMCGGVEEDYDYDEEEKGDSNEYRNN